MPGSSVPQPTFGPNGFTSPAQSAVQTGVQADMNAAFGGKLNFINLETPQGQWSTSMTAEIGNANDDFCFYTTQTDPAYATGRMQDAIGRIYYLERDPAEPTAVQATCAGLAGVVIRTGALAKAQDGNTYICTAGGEIGEGGTVSLPFACAVTGPIPCPATTLNTIYQSIPGWDSISNPADGVLGNVVETRAAFELRRQQSVAKNSVGMLASIQGAVLSVPGVLDAYTTDNSTGSPVTLDGVTVGAHSLYVGVAGGDPQGVARAIWTKKPPGTPMSGNTSETVLDTSPGYSIPYPSYTVTFQTLATQTFLFLVEISNGPTVPATAATQIQAAILSAFSGSDGGARARTGSTVYASRYYGPVGGLGPWAGVINIKIGTNRGVAASFTAAIASTVMTVSAVASGTLAVGQTIFGAGLPDGVRIASLGSGAGGTGTYNLNIPQTISSEAMTAVLPALDTVAVGVAHEPVLSAANITVVLI